MNAQTSLTFNFFPLTNAHPTTAHTIQKRNQIKYPKYKYWIFFDNNSNPFVLNLLFFYYYYVVLTLIKSEYTTQGPFFFLLLNILRAMFSFLTSIYVGMQIKHLEDDDSVLKLKASVSNVYME